MIEYMKAMLNRKNRKDIINRRDKGNDNIAPYL